MAFKTLCCAISWSPKSDLKISHSSGVTSWSDMESVTSLYLILAAGSHHHWGNTAQMLSVTPNSSGKILRTSQERQHLVPHFWIKLRSIVNIKVSTPTSHFNTSLNKGQKNHNGEWYEPASMSSNATLLEFLNTGFDHGLPLPGERMRQGAPLRSDSVLKTVTQQLYTVCPAPAPNYPK